MSEQIVNLAGGVEGLFIKNTRFNTTLVSCNMYLPLKRETAAQYGLLPFILTSSCAKYPDFSRLNYKLNKLYGAHLDAACEKFGDYQLLRMKISVINDRYTLDDESLVKQASDLLLGMIFEPSVTNGAFIDADVEREKRKAIEHIKGEYSEKRTYAKKRLIEEMYKGKAYGVSKCGDIKSVNAITGESLYNAWKEVLETAYIRFQVVGANIPQGLFESIAERFGEIKRENITDLNCTKATRAAKNVKEIVERDDVSQGKLCMGFSCKMHGNDDNSLPLMVASDIFGGGPYSRLFSNVREKMSLCYYCAAGSVRSKGLLTVDSGVELENAQKAQDEILNQLEIVKKGEFSDFEFESSIRSICDTISGYYDSQGALDLWYLLKINNDGLYSPQDIRERVLKITREDVVNAAGGIALHTVYKLLPKEN